MVIRATLRDRLGLTTLQIPAVPFPVALEQPEDERDQEGRADATRFPEASPVVTVEKARFE